MPRLPDLLTTANLCCGMGSILLASQGQLTAACWLVFAGAVFDVFDGLAARALGGGSPLGTQLDSLADMVTFGVAPAFLVFWASGTMIELDLPGPVGMPYTTADITTKAAVLVLVVASCWRLAKFNVDTRQSNGFMGLATPANALFWAALVLAVLGQALHGGPGTDFLLGTVHDLLDSPSALFAACLAMAILMLSSIPLPSLKFKHFGWRGNEVMYLLGGIGLVLVVLYGILGVPLIMVLYILSPLWGRLFKTQDPKLKT